MKVHLSGDGQADGAAEAGSHGELLSISHLRTSDSVHYFQVAFQSGAKGAAPLTGSWPPVLL